MRDPFRDVEKGTSSFRARTIPRSVDQASRQPRTLDMRRMMRFQQKRPRTHRVNPLIRKRRRLQKATRPLDLSERRGDCVRDGKMRFKGQVKAILEAVTAFLRLAVFAGSSI